MSQTPDIDEAGLCASVRQLARFMALSVNPCAIVGADGRVVRANGRFEAVLGGRAGADLLASEALKQRGVAALLDGALRGEEQTLGPLPLADRELYHLTLFPLPDVSGAVPHAGLIFSNVTDQVSSSRALFAALLEAAPDGMLLIDADGRISQVNQQLVELFEHPPGHAGGAAHRGADARALPLGAPRPPRTLRERTEPPAHGPIAAVLRRRRRQRPGVPGGDQPQPPAGPRRPADRRRGARRVGAEAAGGPVPPGAEAGQHRPARRRPVARSQQRARRHQRLRRHHRPRPAPRQPVAGRRP